ncbi:class I SAM-dependent methyltransferase [Poseidonibacter sp.]|uniref:class I SAM-dependent methyltransferase n=1 Tax=Poseidonibacter sp. TaxID=2321188 RepID=UPI003C735926
MNIEDLKQVISKNLENTNEEFKRVFHGRGNFYEEFKYLTIDSIDKILFIVLFEEIEKNIEDEIIGFLKEFLESSRHESIVLQRRYLEKAPSELIVGEIDYNLIAIENSLKYKISFTNKNIGFFPDMKIGHKFIEDESKGKSVLNLFSYTCAFSISALKGGAKKVVNVDMSKGALTQGRTNHHLNNFDTSNVQFMPYNILKSWSRIRKAGPYDIIVIDPPSFQKGSFAATKDYEKIVKKLSQLASPRCMILCALNAPELDTNFIKNMFNEHASDFKFIKRLDNLDTFPSNNEEKSLKNLVFKRG